MDDMNSDGLADSMALGPGGVGGAGPSADALTGPIDAMSYESKQQDLGSGQSRGALLQPHENN